MIIFDFETRGPCDLIIHGVDRHAPLLTDITLITWIYGETPSLIGTWFPGKPLPTELFDRVRAGEFLMAWNSRYDRKVWNEAAVPLYGFPPVPMEQFLDVAVQGRASLLPASLDQASRATRLPSKPKAGQTAMKSYMDSHSPEPSYDPDNDEVFKQFIAYGIHDSKNTMKLWQRTRKLSEEEWTDFIVSEAINDRGIGIDVEFCQAAAKLFNVVKEENRAECARITNGEILNVTYSQAISKWVYAKLTPAEIADVMVTEWGEDGEAKRLSLDSKKVLPQLIDHFKTTDTVDEYNLLEFLELLSHARSNSALKFKKIFLQEVDGRLYGSYRFNGAGQTGRYSSMGVQTHNLARAQVKGEGQAMQDIVNGVDPAVLKQRYGPLGKVLAQLARPSIVAPEGRTLVWGDWSAIEARVLPWLADSRSSREVLDVFASGQDLYILTAMDIFNVAYAAVTPDQRQAAKVAVLALGFGGSVGAYRAMARGYGMSINMEQGQAIVDGWRGRNRWATKYWWQVWDAAVLAIRLPGSIQSAGRVDYLFDPKLMGGSLLCYLPCGRPLVYPGARYEEEYDEERGRTRKVLTYMNGGHRFHIWYGKLVENIAQGTAASLLRAGLRDLHGVVEVTMHTHDEIGCECDEKDAASVVQLLEEVMNTGPEWAGGLPLASEIKTNWYYTKGV